MVKIKTFALKFDNNVTVGRPSEKFIQPENASKHLRMRISWFLHVFRAPLALVKDGKNFFKAREKITRERRNYKLIFLS